MLKCSVACALLTLLLLPTSCKEPTPAPAVERTSAPASKVDVAGDAAAAMKVHRIVFLDQESCCDCTKERQAAAWQVLQDVLAQRKLKPAIEVVHSDVALDDAQMYRDLKPTMVMPGFYFFDANQMLVEHLQGEVTAEQLIAILD
jgi:hypothetical protein